MAFRSWLQTLKDDRKAATSPQVWLGTIFSVLCILALVSLVPFIREWFQLPFLPALLCFLPAASFGLIASIREARGHHSLHTFGVLVVIGNALLQFFFAALISLSRPPGSFALASLLVLTLAFHGYVTRTSLRFPYALGGTIVALAAAFALNPTRENGSVFAFVVPTGLLVGLLTGQAGLREHEDRREREKLRQAIHYRALSERVLAHDALSERLVDLLKYNHDAGNTLSTVFLSAQLLEEQVERQALEDGLFRQLQPTVKRLLTHLEHIKSLIKSAHQFAEAPLVQEANLSTMLSSVIEECRGIYPGVRIVPAPLDPDLDVEVQEGEVGLRRIVENLLHNACEGNGDEHAYEVQVEASATDTAVLLTIRDNGPGFTREQLESDPVPFRTTKAKGSGLGLFSVGHMLSASSGSLKRSNTSETGAKVEVRFVRAAPRHSSADSWDTARSSGTVVRPGAGPETKSAVGS